MERVNVKEDIQQSDGNIQIAKVDNSDFHIYFNNNTAEKTLKGEKKFMHYFEKQFLYSSIISLGTLFLVHGVLNIFHFSIKINNAIAGVELDEVVFDYMPDSSNSISIAVGAAFIAFGLMMKKGLKKD